jgi:predicted AAA+ superfamily ATPase
VLADAPGSEGFRGGIAENFVATEIAAALEADMYYWGSDGSAEVDLLISDGRSVVPMEVKSGDRFRAAGLKEYIDRYSPEKSVIVSRKGPRDGSVTHIPPYLVWDARRRLDWDGS